MIALTALYALLAVVEVGLLLRTIQAGAEEYVEPPDPSIRGREDDDAPLAFAY